MSADRETPFQQKAYPERFSINQLIGIGLVTRLFTDSGVQVFFPFLRAIADGLGISTVELGRWISLRSLMGLLSPLFGIMADRRGYRHVMRLGLLLGAVGYASIALSVNVWTFAAGLILSAVGTFAFLPSLGAYLSARLPYHRRARGLGIVEYAWALSGILGLYLFGQLINTFSWRLPFAILAVGLFLAFLFYRFLPPANAPSAGPKVHTVLPWQGGTKTPDDSSMQVAEASKPMGFAFLGKLRIFFDLGGNRRSAWASLMASALVMFSGFHLFISYGVWLSDEYGQGPAQLGLIALILGVADLCASVSVSVFADRIGKRRSLMGSASLVMAGCLLLPWLNHGLGWATVGLILVRFSFELCAVTVLPLISEQAPEQRGKVMSLMVATSLLGTSFGGLTGPWAYETWGVWGLGYLPALTFLLTVLIVWLWVRERPAVHPPEAA